MLWQPRGVADSGGPLERDHELEILTNRIDSVASGDGGLLLVEGPAGIGKSTLLAAAVAHARRAGMTVLRAQGSPLEMEYPFGVVRQLFDPLRTVDPDRWARLMTGAAELATGVFEPAPGAGGAIASAGSSSHAAFHGLYWLAANLAAENPVLAAVDDLQWVDLVCLLWMAYLARRLEGMPLLMVAAVRSGEPPADPLVLGEIEESAAWPPLRPAPLSNRATAVLVRQRLGASATHRFCRGCHDATGGNPFLLRALLETLAAAACPPTDATAQRLDEFGPDAVARQIDRRLARLPPGAADFVEALAVLGDHAPTRRVAALAGVDAARASGVADALRAARILTPARELEFVHPVVRSAISARLAPGARADAHLRAARLLADDDVPVDRVAVHLLAAEPRDDPWVVDTLRGAADRANASGDTVSAVRFLRRALAEKPPPSLRPRIELELGLAAMAGRDPQAAYLLREAVHHETDPGARVAAALRAAGPLRTSGRPGDTIEVCEDALAVADGIVDETTVRRLQAELLASCAQMAATVHRFYTAVDAHPAAVGPGARARAAALRGVPVEDDIDRVESGALQVVEAEDFTSSTLIASVILLTFSDRLQTAKRICDDVIAAGQRLGSRNIVATFSCIRSGVAQRAGAIDEAEADARMSFEVNLDTLDASGIAGAVTYLVDALIERADVPGAEKVLRRSGLDGPVPELFSCALLVEGRGRLYCAAGRLDDGLAEFADAGARWQALGVVNPMIATWRVDAALAHLRRGELDQAARLADDNLAAARRCGQARAVGVALRVKGLTTTGAAQLDLLAESVATLEQSPARLELARSLTALGSALRRGGRRMDSREPLRRALDIAHRCGATAAENTVRDELVAAGARPRRAAATGADALTVRERRIVEMAADGLTNREIAQRLFVTQRTVETHLHNAFAKLGVRSRSELAGHVPFPGRE